MVLVHLALNYITIKLYLNVTFPEAGLNFGASFQSLEKGWRNSKTSDGEKYHNIPNDKISNNDLLIAVKVPEDTEKYIAHPVLVDAMIQAAMLWGSGKTRIQKRLHVPVCIREFIWLRGTDSPARFVYCKTDKDNNLRVTLLDGNGLSLMSMSGIDFVETSASVVESMIYQQSSQLPSLWEEVWRHRPGPLESKQKFSKVENGIFSEDQLKEAFAMNEIPGEELAVHNHLCEMTAMHFLDTLYDLGWNPKLGDQFTPEGLMSELAITSPFTNFTKFFLKALKHDQKLGQIDTDSTTSPKYIVTETLPSREAVSIKLRQTVSSTEAGRADYKTINEIGLKLKDILIGKTNPLAVWI